MDYRKKIIQGLSWHGFLRYSTRAGTFLRTAAFARLLNPFEFGIFGIAFLVLGFLEIITETGINVFLIQRKEKLEEFIDSAWIVSIGRGAFVSLLILASAPFVANFFNSPQATSSLILVSLVPLLRGFINPSIVRFQKNLEFNKEAALRFSVFILDTIVAVVLAFLTRSANSLIYGMLAGVVLELAVSFLFISPRPKLKFRSEKVSEVLSFGKWITTLSIFNYLSEHGDDIVVGRLFNTSLLGIYQMGYRLAILPITEVSDVFNKVSFPLYSQISGRRDRLLKAFASLSLLSLLLSVLLGAILFIFPEEIVRIFLGEQWLAATGIIRILAAYGVLRAFSGSLSSLLISLGRQKEVALANGFRFLTLALLVVPLTMSIRLEGAAYAALLSAFFELPIVAYFTYKTIRRI